MRPGAAAAHCPVDPGPAAPGLARTTLKGTQNRRARPGVWPIGAWVTRPRGAPPLHRHDRPGRIGRCRREQKRHHPTEFGRLPEPAQRYARGPRPPRNVCDCPQWAERTSVTARPVRFLDEPRPAAPAGRRRAQRVPILVPGGQQPQGIGRRRARDRAVGHQDLLGVIRHTERLVGQLDHAHHRMPDRGRGVALVPDRMVGPEPAEQLAAHRQVPDQFGQGRVLGMPPGVDVQKRHEVGRLGRPVHPQLPGHGLVGEEQPGEVALPQRKRVEVRDQGRTEVVAGEHIGAPPHHVDGGIGHRVEEVPQRRPDPLRRGRAAVAPGPAGSAGTDAPAPGRRAAAPERPRPAPPRTPARPGPVRAGRSSRRSPRPTGPPPRGADRSPDGGPGRSPRRHPPGSTGPAGSEGSRPTRFDDPSRHYAERRRPTMVLPDLWLGSTPPANQLSSPGMVRVRDRWAGSAVATCWRRTAATRSRLPITFWTRDRRPDDLGVLPGLG